jgi:nucleoside-diphosphate-sugar epimerase
VTARILVTGGEGLVGSPLVAHLLAHGHAVTTLTLPGAEPHEGVRVVRGDARDPDVVAEAADGVDAVIHLAAIPDPFHDPATTVFANNTVATFTVLWTAAEHGVRRFAIASSVNATGRPMNPHRPLPPRFPVDEDVALDLADPYSLSKQVDEHTLRAVCRRFDATGVAFRLPLMVSEAMGMKLRDWDTGRLEESIADGWGWLDVRDSAEAFRLAITHDYTGTHVLHLAAPETCAAPETEELIARFAPGVPRDERYPGRQVPVDTSRATALLGFLPRFTGTLG